MAGILRFTLFFVGVCLLFGSVLLAYPGGPAYEQSMTHNATLRDIPDGVEHVRFYRHLTARQRSYVERALDGETVRVPAHQDLPPEVIYHQNRSEVYQFEITRYYDTGRTAGQAGIIAFGGGLAALIAAIRMERGH